MLLSNKLFLFIFQWFAANLCPVANEITTYFFFNMVNNFNWFLNAELTLHSWNKPYKSKFSREREPIYIEYIFSVCVYIYLYREKERFKELAYIIMEADKSQGKVPSKLETQENPWCGFNPRLKAWEPGELKVQFQSECSQTSTCKM